MAGFSRHLYLKQSAILWSRNSVNEEGRPTFGSPSTIDVAWHEEAKEVRTLEGEVFHSTATVYTNTEMQVGDYLKEGDSVSGVSSDPMAEDAFEIRKTFKIPSTDGRHYIYGAMVK